jgi:hypothetical protein
MAHKQQGITKTYGAQTTGNYQDLWRTNNRKLPRLMAHKQQQYIAVVCTP